VDIETCTDPLRAIRGVLGDADDVLPAVAFVQRRGVNPA
jgi:hypothetical protein